MKFLPEYPESKFEQEDYFDYQKPSTKTNIIQLQQRIDLHYLDNRSDKVYIIRIVKVQEPNVGDKYITKTYYGRRGSTLNVGTEVICKTFQEAKSMAEKIKLEKMNKGYELKEDAKYMSQTTSDTISLPINFNIPQYTEFDYNDLGLLDFSLDSHDIVCEKITNNLVYVLFRSNCISIFNIDTKELIVDIAYEAAWFPKANTFNDYLFLASVDDFGTHYSILDILSDCCTNEHVLSKKSKTKKKKVHERSWKERRGMLTYIFGELFDDFDPYDTKAMFHLNDYHYEDKITFVNKMKHNETVIIRNIHSPYTDRWIVIKK